MEKYVPKTWSGKHETGICPCCGRRLEPVYTAHNHDWTTITKTYNCFDCNIVWEEYYTVTYDGFHDGKYIYGPDGDAYEQDHDRIVYERNFIRGGGSDEVRNRTK